jgi:hypothetical protein
MGNEVDEWRRRGVRMMILSAVGNGIITVIKWILKIMLGMLRMVLELAKVILLLFGLVARLFLAFVRAGTP